MNIELIKDESSLRQLSSNKVLNETYRMLSETSNMTCLLIKDDNANVSLSFAMKDPYRIFIVSYKDNKYSLEMKLDCPFKYESLSESDTFALLNKLKKRQSIWK